MFALNGFDVSFPANVFSEGCFPESLAFVS